MNSERQLILGRLADLAPDAMRAVEVAGKKILLLRQGGAVTAIGAECPHAGGPLVEGILADGQVICPWHKAAFCSRTGALLEPPAVDALPCYSVAIENGDIVLRDPAPRSPSPPVAKDYRHFVIVGAGGAGFSAAQELRNAGFAGAITLASREPELPYDRTVLSKYFLSGSDQGGEKSPLQTEEFFKTYKIDRLQGEIVELDPRQKSIALADGSSMHYDSALIATGGDTVAPPFPGADLANVFTLRSQQDARRILQAAERGGHAVIIGASFIGMEVAAALRERGLEVSVVGPETAPLERQLGARIGNVYRQIHEEKSVKFHLGRPVERLTGGKAGKAVEAVVLEGGEILPADLVVAGLGVKPATSFIAPLTRQSDGAVEVDSLLRVTGNLSGNLYAAGDVAAFPLYGDGPLIRVEHWRVAEQQGMLAARNMAGRSVRFCAVPYFWTIQYMIRLDYVGHASGEDELVIRGELSEKNFIAYYIRDGVVAAAAGMNRDQDMAAIVTMMNRRQDWTVDEMHPLGSSPAGLFQATPH